MGTVRATTESHHEVTTEETEEKREKTTGCQSPKILRMVCWVYPAGKRNRGKQLADDGSFVDLLA